MAAALVHMAPYWRAARQAPDGWSFTGNLSLSPDYMQYRVWERQTQEEGIFVSNRFTAEANPPHLPVLLYWSVGRVSKLTGIAPEWVYAWLGGLLALVFTPLVYAIARHFLPTPSAAAWVFWVMLVGGGLGGILELIRRSGLADRFTLIHRLVVLPMEGPGYAAPFEHYRGNYIVQALMDTHFLVLWWVGVVAILALYETYTRFSPGRLASVVLLFAGATFLHVYEGLLLLTIAAATGVMVWRKGVSLRRILVTLGATGLAVALVLLPLAMRFQAAGLPLSTWRGVIVAPVVLLLAYPLAWPLLGAGLTRFWREQGVAGAFLAGWAVGCLVITLSGPFYPYPDRGILTLQIPLLVMAGMIYFARRRSVGWGGAIVVVLLHVSTPLLLFADIPRRTTFNPDWAHKWVGPSHRAVARTLATEATEGDLLLADEVELRWLAPAYRGRHFAGHFFLTVDYERKRAAAEAFFRGEDPAAQAAFLSEAGITLVFVPSRREPSRFLAVPGLTTIVATPVGTLFRVNVPEGPAARDGGDR